MRGDRGRRGQRVPSVFTSLLSMPSASSGAGHMPMNRLARVWPPSSRPSDLVAATLGAGPLLQRDYWAVLDRCALDPSDLMATWAGFIRNTAASVNAGIPGVIHAETRHVDEVPEDDEPLRFPTFVAVGN